MLILRLGGEIMNININKVTGYYDKKNERIKVGDCLVFENGSKYIVIISEYKLVLKSISSDSMPTILLSKITYGNIFGSATITT